MIRHTSPISDVTCDGNKYVATAGYDNKIILWSLNKDNLPIAVSQGNHDHLVNQCIFDHTGKFLLTASSDYSARLWSIPNLNLKQIFLGHKDDVEMAIFLNSSNKIATASTDSSIRIFDLSGKCLNEIKGHKASVKSICFDESDNTIVSSSNDCTIRKWCANTGIQKNIYEIKNTDIDTFAIDKHSKIFVGDHTGTITWNHIHNLKCKDAHESAIKKLIINKDRNELISIGYDKKLKIWKIINNSLHLVKIIDLPNEVWPKNISSTKDLRLIFLTSFGHTFSTFDNEKNNWIKVKDNRTNGINSIMFYNNNLWSIGDSGIIEKNGLFFTDIKTLCNFLLPINDQIITSGQKGEIYKIDLKTKKNEIIYTNNCPINCGIYLNNTILFGLYSGELLSFTYNPHESKWEIERKIDVFPNAIKDITNINDTTIFVVSANGDIAWLNVNGKIIHYIKSAHNDIGNSCIKLKNNVIATVSRDKHLYLWRDGRLIEKIKSPHTHSIKTMTFNEPWIITGSYDGSIHFYNLLSKLWTTKYYRPTTSGISSLAISYNNCNEIFINASSYNGNIYKYPLPCYKDTESKKYI